MHQQFFGEARDLAKRQLIEWLTPNERWAAHPMWYGDRDAEPHIPDFLDHYAAAIGVEIVPNGDCANPAKLLGDTLNCRRHLFLDPDTGLGERTPRNNATHVDYKQFVQICQNPLRDANLILVYDQAYSRGINQARFTIYVQNKVALLNGRDHVHAAGYLAEPAMKVAFIWASRNLDVVRDATQNLQEASHFPVDRFV
jgi:hypothetical protein